MGPYRTKQERVEEMQTGGIELATGSVLDALGAMYGLTRTGAPTPSVQCAACGEMHDVPVRCPVGNGIVALARGIFLRWVWEELERRVEGNPRRFPQVVEKMWLTTKVAERRAAIAVANRISLDMVTDVWRNLEAKAREQSQLVPPETDEELRARCKRSLDQVKVGAVLAPSVKVYDQPFGWARHMGALDARALDALALPPLPEPPALPSLDGAVDRLFGPIEPPDDGEEMPINAAVPRVHLGRIEGSFGTRKFLVRWAMTPLAGRLDILFGDGVVARVERRPSSMCMHVALGREHGWNAEFSGSTYSAMCWLQGRVPDSSNAMRDGLADLLSRFDRETSRPR